MSTVAILVANTIVQWPNQIGFCSAEVKCYISYYNSWSQSATSFTGLYIYYQWIVLNQDNQFFN